MLINKISLASLLAFACCVFCHAQGTAAGLADAPVLPLKAETVIVQPASPDGTLGGKIVSVAADRKAELAYVLVRADTEHDSILVVNRQGRIVRSWGRGLFATAHNIKMDTQGNIWTADAGNSRVMKFAPDGTMLLQFYLGDTPTIATGGCAFPARPANGNVDGCATTDVIVTADERIFVTDGYGKKRVLEYSASGDRRIREWGGPGTGPGKFTLPHGLAYDGKGVLFVADRDGGRIERFDDKGTYLGEWNHLGNAGCIAYSGGFLWAVSSVQTGQPAKRVAWLLKIDSSSGKILGKIEAATADFIDVNDNGEVIAGVSGGGFVRYSPIR